MSDTLAGRIRDANLLRLHTSRLKVLRPIPIPTTFARQLSQNRVMERSSSILRMGSDRNRPNCGAMQPSAIL